MNSNSVNLKDLELDIEYSSDSSSIVDSFYFPCLKVATRYDRAVGYFTSYGLYLISPGLDAFLDKQGKIRLIASPVLTEDDIEAINKGYKDRNNVILEGFYKTLDDKVDHLNLLSWLISNGVLEIKLAIRISTTNRNIQKGIFHEKMGIFYDSLNNGVAFSGSANETIGGLVDNHESINVFNSWDESRKFFHRKETRFASLWNNATDFLEVIDFTEATSELLKPYKTSYPTYKDSVLYSESLIRIPNNIILREYQKTAINSWFQNRGSGIFQMATGTGKTITALALITTLHQKANLEAVVIVCPYKHLVDQWNIECTKFGAAAILAYGQSKNWTPILTNALNSRDGLLCVITTTATFINESFQNQLEYFPNKTIFVADEVHNMGAKTISAKLPIAIKWRLGLSATPERWFDEAGTQNIYDYFGAVLEPRLTIKDALELKVLCPYYYQPMLIELTIEEQEQYLELSEKISKCFAISSDLDEENNALQTLLFKRARLIASAKNKLTALSSLMADKVNDTHMLIYCGDGNIESDIDESSKRQIDAICELLGHELGMKIASYTAETEIEERQQLCSKLDNGELQALVAIKCLDEGVDIPSIKTAILLASSTNPKQFIQRRGRILRLFPNKEFATIYDMIVVPPKEVLKYETERSLLKKELLRFTEFSNLALNQATAKNKILKLQKAFDLMDI